MRKKIIMDFYLTQIHGTELEDIYWAWIDIKDIAIKIACISNTLKV